MSVQQALKTAEAQPVNAALVEAAANASVVYHSAEREILRHVELRSLSAVEQMYTYFGADLA
ncbi:hypothetical protein [Pseudogemmobacter sonorensis]|uniref:hypothetical protein n=1 Tax=Pseudogemmobacter sonorensis TaxID=2989681 RepID=UPI0036BA2ADB